MDGVVLLSEVHPGNLAVTNPLMQAVDWFGLIDLKQAARWKRVRKPTMLQFVGMCEAKASARGEALVLRDWSHLDYYGKPFVKPKMGTKLRDSLKGAYEVVEACSVRHPADQYVSLSKVPVYENGGGLEWDLFLDGGLVFAEYAKACGFVRYEDLTNDPDGELKKLCGMLEVDFDPGYSERWAGYEYVTGDVVHAGVGISEGSGLREIRPLVRKGVDEGLLARFRADERYVKTCELLGYEV